MLVSICSLIEVAARLSVVFILKERKLPTENSSNILVILWEYFSKLQKIELNTKTTIAGVDALTRIGTAGLQAQQSIINLTSAGVTTYAG